MARLGDIVAIQTSSKRLGGNRFWLLNLDMVEQQTGNIIGYNYVSADCLNGSIIQFDSDAVLYSKLRPNLNKVVLPQMDGYATSEILPLKPDSKKLDRAYLAEYLRSDGFVTWAVSKTAGAKMPRLGTKELLNAEIPLPSLEEQRHIAQLFNQTNTLIALRKQQLAKLDDLVKARFVELFGEIKKTTRLVSCCDRITDYVASGSFASIRENVKTYDNEEYAVMVKTADFANGFTKNLTYTDKHGYDFLHNSNLFGGELLLSNIGASIGKVHRVPKLNRPMTLAPNSIMIKGNGLFLDDYLQHFFLSHLGQRQLKEMTTATAMPKFNKTQLKEVIVPVAPIELQHQFAAFVKQTDKSKLAIQKSLDKLETLKKSLMQKYFG